MQYAGNWLPASGCRLCPAMISPQPIRGGNKATVATAHARMPVMPLIQATPTTTAPALPVLAAATDMPMLTRGARRRQKQRLRKKLGRLERASAATEMDLSAAEQTVFAAKSSSAAADSLAVTINDEVPEAPIFMTNKILQQRAFDLPITDLSLSISASASGEKVVPVCAIQKDVKLHEAAEVEIADMFVALPSQSTRQAHSKTAEESKDKQDKGTNGEFKLLGKASELQACNQRRVWADDGCKDGNGAMDARAHARSLARTSASPLSPGSQMIPTANTFVHFHSDHEQLRRRSLSV